MSGLSSVQLDILSEDKKTPDAISALSPQLLLLPVRSGTGKVTDIAAEHCQVMATMHSFFSLDKAFAFQSLNGRIHNAC